MEKIDNLFDKIVKIANARGFVFNASSIYGGLRSSYDYGPLGTLLKNNISGSWWKDINQDSKVSIFPIDTAIIQSSEVWKASGHLAEFTDPMVDHKPTGERFRADQVPENLKKEDLTEPRQFNLMFETNIGPVQNENEWFDFWVNKRLDWYKGIGIPEEKLRLREHEENELAHYASKTVDIEFDYPWGWGELEGIANRGSFDLSSHESSSGKDLSYFDSETNEKIAPVVIEPAGGLTRTLFALLCSTYDEEVINDTTRTLFRFNFEIAPVQIGILPLSKKEELIKVSNEIQQTLQKFFRTEVDVTQSIGKRYRRQDEIGTPYCVTIDFDSLEDLSVTIRNRDSMDQERIKIEDLLDYFSKI